MTRLSSLCLLYRQKIAKQKRISLHNFTRAKKHWALKNRAVKHKCMKLAVFPARIDIRRQFLEERRIQFPTRESRRQNPGVNARRDRTKALRVEKADQLPRISFPCLLYTSRCV